MVQKVCIAYCLQHLIADQKSSTFEGKPRHSWARNHTQMNKFDSPKDNFFKDISTVLGDYVQQSTKKIRLRQDGELCLNPHLFTR
jgi:hypothetical protein